MAKKKRSAPRTRVPDSEVPVVGPREPCPCGSGKKYRLCHGKQAAAQARRLVARPFAGLADECDWVAMREMVPAATAPLHLTGEWADKLGDRELTLATVLPLAWPGVVRRDGSIMLGAQTPGGSSDLSRDVADVLERVLDAAPGSPVLTTEPAGPGPRLQDMLDPAAPLTLTIHDGFDFWLEAEENVPPEVEASMERANAGVVPTVRLSGVSAAYWVRIGSKEHLRWVLPHDEEKLLDALARLHAAGTDSLGEGTRFIGSFRAHGLLVPVWDLAPGTAAVDVEQPALDYQDRLDEALSDPAPLTPAERGARAGLANRQLTLR